MPVLRESFIKKNENTICFKFETNHFFSEILDMRYEDF